MAILRSVDGQFYEIPDEQLPALRIPFDRVKAQGQAARPCPEVPRCQPAPAAYVAAEECRTSAWWGPYRLGWHNVWHNRYF
jgi:hypothetical protein